MTNKQYKNIIKHTLSNKSATKDKNSFEVVKKVFQNCGVPFPTGDRKKVVDSLTSGTYIGWKACSAKEAQAAADSGIAAVGIMSDRAVVVEPSNDIETLSAISETESEYSVNVASMASDEVAATTFYSQANFSYNENGDLNTMTITTEDTTTDTQEMAYISFDLNGGSGSFASESVVCGHQIILPVGVPTREHYSFSGWFDGSAFYYPGDLYSVMGNTVFVAQWCECEKYTLSFDLNGGIGLFPSVLLYADETITLSTSIPEREGYVFLYWVDYTGNVYIPGSQFSNPHEDVVLTAVWEEEEKTLCVICYDLNGGEGTFAPQTVYCGDAIIIPSNTPTKAHFQFTGWLCSSGGMYYPEDLCGISGDTVFVAQWFEYPQFTLSFNLNGGVGYFPAMTLYVDETITLSSEVPEKEGYVFLHWEDCSGNSYAPGSSFNIPHEDTELIAVWEQEKTACVICYDLNGGEGTFAPQSALSGDGFALPVDTPTKAHCAFSGWLDGEGNVFNPGDIYLVTGDVVFVAAWFEYPQFTLSFDLNGGTGSFPAMTVYSDEPVTLTEDIPEKEGYAFLHWEDCSGIQYAPGSTFYVSMGDVELIAVWEEEEEKIVCTVCYDLNGGEGTFAPQSALSGDEFALPVNTPTKAHCAFSGWLDGEGNVFNPGDIYLVTGDVVFVAAWFEFPQYTLSFDLNGGDGCFPAMTLYVDETITLPSEIPEKEGYVFLRWEDCSGNSYAPGSSFNIPHEDVELTAVWLEEEKTVCTVCYDVNGGEGTFASQSALYGDEITIPSDAPTKEHCDFWGWFDGVSNYYYPSDTYPVTGDVVLVAQWYEHPQFTLYFDLNGGDGCFPDMTVYVNEPITLPTEAPEREGYVFKYWEDCAGNQYTKGSSFSSPYEDSVLTAVWEEVVSYTINYVLDGGEGDFPQQTKYKDENIELHSDIPTREGYTFLWWEEENTGAMYDPGERYVANLNATMVAQWEIVEYTITFETYGATNSAIFYNQEKPHNVDINLTSDIPEKPGYKFEYWTADEDDTETVSVMSARTVSSSLYQSIIYPGALLTSNNAMNLRAIYSGPYPTVTYDLNGGSGVFLDQTKTPGTELTLHCETPHRYGYMFAFWSNSKDTYNYLPGDTYYLDQDAYMVAEWIENSASGVSITNAPESCLMTVGQTYTLESLVTPFSADDRVTWESSDTNVASVDSNGKVTAVSHGEVTITVTTVELAQDGCYAQSSITLYITEFEDWQRIYANPKDDPKEAEENLRITRWNALKKMDEYYADESNGLKAFIDGQDCDCGTCIFAFEGLGGDLGSISVLHPNGFLKAMMVVTEGKQIKYVTRNASTFPDERPNNFPGSGITTLTEGIYDYNDGYHNDYTALIPTYKNYPGWYYNTTNGFYTEYTKGVNIHATGVNAGSGKSAHSKGCQTVYVGDYFEFGKKAGFLDCSCNPSYIPTTGIGTALPGIIGKNNGYKRNISIKYILNRDYDEKNTSYISSGVFYPENHTCNEKCKYC